MSHFYENVLEPVLNRPMEGLIKFLRLKRMLKQMVMSHECCVDMVCKLYTQIKDGIWRLGAITKNVIVIYQVPFHMCRVILF